MTDLCRTYNFVITMPKFCLSPSPRHWQSGEHCVGRSLEFYSDQGKFAYKSAEHVTLFVTLPSCLAPYEMYETTPMNNSPRWLPYFLTWPTSREPLTHADYIWVIKEGVKRAGFTLLLARVLSAMTLTHSCHFVFLKRVSIFWGLESCCLHEVAFYLNPFSDDVYWNH